MIHTTLVARSAYIHSPGIDEVGHFAAGLYHWEKGRFEFYRVNPPLVRMVALSPVAVTLDEPVIPIIGGAQRAEFLAGRRLVHRFGEEYRFLLTIARWACLPFSLLGALIAFVWAREMYGSQAGLVALTLWCFDPNIIAYSSMIIPDIGATSLGLLACYLFWKWLREPTWTGVLMAGIALGLAESAKSTWILAYLVFPVMWCVARFVMKSIQPRLATHLFQLACLLLLSLIVLNLHYRFDGTFHTLGSYRFRSELLRGTHDENRFRDSLLEHLPVPFPEQYVLGIDDQKCDFEARLASYLRGEWREGGWWYYYLYALLIKTPLGTLALVVSSLVLALRSNTASLERGWEWLAFCPGIILFTFVSSQTGFNHHFRYVAPALPFMFLWASRVALDWDKIYRSRRCAIFACVGLSAVSSLANYPHSLSYFNSFVGGSLHGHEHLIDSNIDWGQDLWLLKDWMEQHPEADPLYLYPFTIVDPQDLGLKTLPATRNARNDQTGKRQVDPIPGWHAVSVNFLQWDNHPSDAGFLGTPLPKLGYLKQFEPYDRVGYSIYIYHLTERDIAPVRKKHGLPVWDAESKY